MLKRAYSTKDRTGAAKVWRKRNRHLLSNYCGLHPPSTHDVWFQRSPCSAPRAQLRWRGSGTLSSPESKQKPRWALSLIRPVPWPDPCVTSQETEFELWDIALKKCLHIWVAADSFLLCTWWDRKTVFMRGKVWGHVELKPRLRHHASVVSGVNSRLWI